MMLLYREALKVVKYASDFNFNGIWLQVSASNNCWLKSRVVGILFYSYSAILFLQYMEAAEPMPALIVLAAIVPLMIKLYTYSKGKSYQIWRLYWLPPCWGSVLLPDQDSKPILMVMRDSTLSGIIQILTSQYCAELKLQDGLVSDLVLMVACQELISSQLVWEMVYPFFRWENGHNFLGGIWMISKTWAVCYPLWFEYLAGIKLWENCGQICSIWLFFSLDIAAKKVMYIVVLSWDW